MGKVKINFFPDSLVESVEILGKVIPAQNEPIIVEFEDEMSGAFNFNLKNQAKNIIPPNYISKIKSGTTDENPQEVNILNGITLQDFLKGKANDRLKKCFFNRYGVDAVVKLNGLEVDFNENSTQDLYVVIPDHELSNQDYAGNVIIKTNHGTTTLLWEKHIKDKNENYLYFVLPTATSIVDVPIVFTVFDVPYEKPMIVDGVLKEYDAVNKNHGTIKVDFRPDNDVNSITLNIEPVDEADKRTFQPTSEISYSEFMDKGYKETMHCHLSWTENSYGTLTLNISEELVGAEVLIGYTEWPVDQYWSIVYEGSDLTTYTEQQGPANYTLIVKKDNQNVFTTSFTIGYQETKIIELTTKKIQYSFVAQLPEGVTATLNNESYTGDVVKVDAGSTVVFEMNKPGHEPFRHVVENVSDNISFDGTAVTFTIIRSDVRFNLILNPTPANPSDVTVNCKVNGVAYTLNSLDVEPKKARFFEGEQILFEFEGNEKLEALNFTKDITSEDIANGINIIINRKKLDVVFRTYPIDATVHVNNVEQQDKRVKVYYGDKINYFATHRDFVTSVTTESDFIKTSEQVIDIKLEALPIDFVVNNGTNSDLSRATMLLTTRDLDAENREEKTVQVSVDTPIKVKANLEYELHVEQEGYESVVINGTTTNENHIVTINNWKLSAFVVTLPEDIVKPVILAKVKTPKHETVEKQLVPDVRNEFPYGTEIGVIVMSSNYEKYESVLYTLDTELVTANLSNELLKKVVLLEMRTLTTPSLKLIGKNGEQVDVQILIDSAPITKNDNLLPLNKEVSVEYVCEGYNSYKTTFVLKQDTSLNVNLIRARMRRKPYSVKLNLTDDSGVAITDDGYFTSEVTSKIYESNGKLVNDAFTIDKVTINIDGYKKKTIDVSFNEPSSTLDVQLTKTVVKVAEKGKALIDSLTQEEIDEWLDKIEPKFAIMGYYSHIRIGVAFKAYGFTVRGLKAFYQYFGRHCSHRYDFENYAELKKMFEIRK